MESGTIKTAEEKAKQKGVREEGMPVKFVFKDSFCHRLVIRP